MDSHFLLLFSICSLLVMASHAAISSEAYWKQKLPNTPIPLPIKNSLPASGINPVLRPRTLKASVLRSMKRYIESLDNERSLLSTVDNTQQSDNKEPSLAFPNNAHSHSNEFWFENGQVQNNGHHHVAKSHNSEFWFEDEETGDSSRGRHVTEPHNSEFWFEDNEAGSSKDHHVAKSHNNSEFWYADEEASSGREQQFKKSYNGEFWYEDEEASSRREQQFEKSRNSEFWFEDDETIDNGDNVNKPHSSEFWFEDEEVGKSGGHHMTKSHSTECQDEEVGRSRSQHVAKSHGTKSDDKVGMSLSHHVFFTEKDIHMGKYLSSHFRKGNKNARFLSRDVANKIPFSSDKIPEILEMFSLDVKSKQAQALSRNIKLCEKPISKTVDMKCVTSLESMVDYVISQIGNNVQALYTKIDKDDYLENGYTIEGMKNLALTDHRVILCHKMEYPYAMFYCHISDNMRAYAVTLAADDGSKLEAVAACHKETSELQKEYMIEVLKVMPGSIRICHFSDTDDVIVWVANC